MYLVDYKIKELIKEGYGIIEGYDEASLGAISYDMHIAEVCDINGNPIEHEDSEFIFEPRKISMVKLREKIKVPPNGIIKIESRNSILRLGLDIEAPTYQPGHESYCFIRVRNVSGDTVRIKKEEPIAQAYFGHLSFIPEHLYGSAGHNRYQNECDYKPMTNA